MIKEVLNKLKTQDPFKDKVEHVEVIEPREAVYGEVKGLPENLVKYLQKRNIKLYKHQCRAVELLREDKNVLITTPTSSGKTLAFNLPIMEKLHEDRKATALYIYPAKALANDQLKVLRDFDEYNEVNPNIYDGDTEKDLRPWIRDNSRIILTNPYMLHMILGWHYKWANFYSNLKFVVIDEAHKYRGVFGSNVALLVRRLRHICKFYGSDPQFILSSATLANPEEFSEKLTGKKFELVNEDTSPSGRKYFVLYNPYIKWGNLSTHQETKNIFQLFVKNRLQTLCFTISRKMAEVITMWSRKELDETRPDLAGKITAYRAGYSPEERRKIENGLKNGDLIGVTCTNALELGINIGSLDSVLISGYPGTMISTWQQAGRAGRGVKESMVVMIAFGNALDQYLMKHPRFLFDKTHENAVIDLQNEKIMYSHLLCAVKEVPTTEEDLNEFFGVDGKFFKKLEGKGMVQRTDEGWIYVGRDDPAVKLSLEEVSSDSFKVLYKNHVLEEMDRSHAYSEAHEGAVLIHQGETYLVDSFDIKRHIISVKKIDVDYNTQAMKDTDIEIISEAKSRRIGNFKVSFGDLMVTQNFFKYKQMLYGKTLAVKKLDLPPIKYRTKGLWFTINREVKEEIETMFSNKESYAGSLHGTEHALISLFPLMVLCDRFDIGGLSTPYHPDTGEATIFIYDAYEGGIGLTEKAMEVIEDLVDVAHEMVSSCKCEEGCPLCIYSPKCGNDNKPLHKKGTIYLLNYLRSQMQMSKTRGSKTRIKSTPLPSRGSVGAEAYKEFESPQSIVEQGKKFYSNGNVEAALECFQKALKMDNKILEALNYKGIILELQDHRKEAISTYIEALKLEPENPKTLYLLAVSQFNDENYTSAEEAMSNLLRVKSGDEEELYLMGLLKELKDDYAGAMKYYNEVLKINPDNLDVLKRENNLMKSHRGTIFDFPDILLNDPDGTNRSHVAYLLGETRDPQYVDVLCEATKDNNGNVRRLAAAALGKIRDIKAEDTLINLLGDSKPQIRQYAATSLGKIKSKKALPYLRKLSNDPSSYVKERAEEAISRIKSKNKVC